MKTYNRKQTKGAPALRKKLFSAAAMLLVASIMLVSTSYAWLVLSTAPEVTGINTQVGANGALEIALLDSESYLDLTKVVEADIDESVTTPSGTETNLSWGNLVSLSNAMYGLDEIVLNPSRLNIDVDGDGYKINSVLLKTPVYNEDGRIVKLEQTAVSSTYQDGSFPADGEQSYGVRAIGVAADMSEGQLGINAARSELTKNMASARTTASRTLNAQGDALGNVAVGVALGSTSGFSLADVTAMRDLALGLQSSLDSIETAVRQVYVAYVYTRGLSGEALDEANTEAATASLSTLKARYPDVSLPTTGSGDIVDLLAADQVAVQNAIDACNVKIAENRDNYTQDEIVTLMNPLVNYNSMTIGGKSIDELKALMNDKNYSALFDIMSGGGLTVSVPTGSGILSDIADFAGNYTAEVTVENVSFGSFENLTVTATMATVTSVNPVYLTQCNNLIRTFVISDSGSGGTVITDYYGYAIDLAFRTNVEGSNLQLQTDSVQRIYDDSSNVATQGGGSYMEFSSSVGLSATKMIKLMSGVRVVFMDKEQKVLAIAALDTTLGKDVYMLGSATTTYTLTDTETYTADNCTNYKATLTESEYSALAETTTTDATDSTKYVLGQNAYTAVTGSTMPDGKYAVLKYDNPQNSDYITQAEYEALPEGSAVSISDNGTIRAELYLYDFWMVESTAEEHEGSEETHYTGAIKLGEKLESSAITALEENVAKGVTALVYLDGSIVNNSMVAANSGQSMSGTLNLQFSSSAELVPMNNQKLFDGEEDAQVPTDIIDPDEVGNEEESGDGDDPESGTETT